ncbi:MAG: polysaccharide deacetylase family protein [Lysobacterales bacterium]
MRVPVLTYHAVNVGGSDYANNDHAAFAEDLALIQRLGRRVLPLRRVVDVLLGRADEDLHDAVALSCDDGSDLDYFDLDFPGYGEQRSFYGSLLDFRERFGPGVQPDLHLTCFVIADPEARARMDQACLFGRDWMGGRWWRPAGESGLIAIENHSFDHNHPCLPSPGPHGLVRGDFHAVGDDAQAEFEIAQAQRWLGDYLAPQRPRLFCYPFGHVNAFLRTDWLPRRGPELGIDAAFGDGAEPLTAASDRWNLPRYICGWHWKSPEQLERILRDARE